MDDSFALPAFKPAEALVQLKRGLREMRGLAERGQGFDWKGQAVIELGTTDQAIQARLARRPARTPEWTAFTLKGAPDVRRFTDEVKKRIAQWDHDD
jgi:hypothetical protein